MPDLKIDTTQTMYDQKTTLCRSTNRLKKDLARGEFGLGLDWGSLSVDSKSSRSCSLSADDRCAVLNLDDDLIVRIGDSIYDNLLCEF